MLRESHNVLFYYKGLPLIDFLEHDATINAQQNGKTFFLNMQLSVNLKHSGMSREYIILLHDNTRPQVATNV